MSPTARSRRHAPMAESTRRARSCRRRCPKIPPTTPRARPPLRLGSACGDRPERSRLSRPKPGPHLADVGVEAQLAGLPRRESEPQRQVPVARRRPTAGVRARLLQLVSDAHLRLAPDQRHNHSPRPTQENSSAGLFAGGGRGGRGDVQGGGRTTMTAGSVEIARRHSSRSAGSSKYTDCLRGPRS